MSEDDEITDQEIQQAANLYKWCVDNAEPAEAALAMFETLIARKNYVDPAEMAMRIAGERR